MAGRAGWARARGAGVLWLVAAALLGAAGFGALYRHYDPIADIDPDNSWQHSDLTSIDVLSRRYSEGIAPELAAAIAGEPFASRKLTFLGTPFTPGDKFVMELMRRDWLLDHPDLQAPIKLAIEWDDRVIAALNASGTEVIHPEQLIETRDAGYADQIAAAEEASRPAIERRLADLRDRQHFAEWARGFALVSLIVCLVLAALCGARLVLRGE